MNSILFLCTGNYYRSRMAEEYFNFLAENKSLPWYAESMALSRELNSNGNVGTFSEHARRLLTQNKIDIRSASQSPRTLDLERIDQFEKIIAMSQQEHAPMVQRDWPQIIDRIEYWEVGDIGVDEPEIAFAKVKIGVDKLLTTLTEIRAAH